MTTLSRPLSRNPAPQASHGLHGNPSPVSDNRQPFWSWRCHVCCPSRIELASLSGFPGFSVRSALQSVVTQPPIEIGSMGVRSGGVHEHIATVVHAQVLKHKNGKDANHFQNHLCLALTLQLLVSTLTCPNLPLLLPSFDRAFCQLVSIYPLVENPRCCVLDENGSPFHSPFPL
jgi:hypothetical protein